MIDMTLDKADAEEEASCSAEPPKYPYGLSLSLNDETLERLGMSTMPTVGSQVMLSALATVVTVSERQTQETKEAGEPVESVEKYVELQITALDVTPPQREVGASLYGA